MDFIGAIKSCFKQYANFRGLASRSEYWYFVLFTVLVSIVLSTLESVIWPAPYGMMANGNWMNMMSDLQNQPTPFTTIANIVLFVPSIAVTVRRFHDAGFSGKWLLLYLVPVVVLFVSIFTVALQVFSYENDNLYVSGGQYEAIIAILTAVLPALILFLAVGIFDLVITLLRTKTAEEGNKYAVKYAAKPAAEAPVSDEATPSI